MSDAAHELVVHGDNDSHLFHSSREPIIANLKQKVAKGTYDHEKAKKLWNYHADRTAQSYAKEHGDGKTPWHKQFTTADRKQAASHFADQARDEHLNEEVEQIIETEVLNRYIKSLGYDPIHLDRNKKVMFAKTNAFKSFASRQEGKTPDQEDDIHMSPGATARG